MVFYFYGALPPHGEAGRIARWHVVIAATVPKERHQFMRARKQHSRREIKSYKSEFKKLMAYGTEDQFMRYLREIGIFDEDPRFAAAVNAFRASKKGKL